MKVDTVIVGSGVAATALVQRLLARTPQMSILLLEAGSRYKTMDFGLWTSIIASGNKLISTMYNPIFDLPFPDRDHPGENLHTGTTEMPLQGGRTFVYGGSTMVWGGWSFRLKPEDFHLRTNTGEGLDWPFGYNALEPYYCQAEDYLAVSGDSADTTVPRSRPYPFPAFPFSLEDQPVAQAMEKVGVSYSHMPIARRGISNVPSRHAPCQTTGTCKYCPFGARYAACNYMDDLRQWNDLPNLDIKLGVVVESIRMATKRRAAGLTYKDTASGETFDVDAGRIIVAAGTIESAKLLLRSTSTDWPGGLGNDSDMVGRNIITHPYFVFSGTIPSNPLNLQTEMDFPTLISRHFDSPEEQAKGKFLLINPPDVVETPLYSWMQNGEDRAEIDTLLAGPSSLNMHCMMEVFSRPYNYVRNLPKLNRYGMPQTLINFNADPTFAAREEELLAHVRTIFHAMGGEITQLPQPSWRCDHAAATCRMSVHPSQGVVDGDLRVHGTDNLYVCSNAVFPNIGAINPTVTLTSLALRLGDHLNAAG